jgi:hypothetical protein
VYVITHSLYLVCPDLLRAVGETSYGIRVGFIESTHSLRCLFMYYLYLRFKVSSYLVKQTKVTFLQQKRIQPSLLSRNNNLCFDMDMSYTRVLHIKVAYRVPHK